PFPYQSAMCVGIEHLSDDLEGFAEIAAALSQEVTHFVSSRLRSERLSEIARGARIDIGWNVRHEDIELSSRRTLSHWKTRVERFNEAGVDVTGLSIRCHDQ